MKKFLIILAPFAAMAFAAGCQSTQPTRAELREAIIETAAEEEDGQQVAVSDPDYDPNEMICKTVEETGSRLSRKKDCRTAKQWRDSMSAATRSMNDLSNSKGGIGTRSE